MRRYTAARTRALADAFCELYETVRRSAESKENDADIATVYDRAAEELCVRCPRRKSAAGTRRAHALLNDATAAMRRRGASGARRSSGRFRAVKASAPFTAAVNSELPCAHLPAAARSRGCGEPHGALTDSTVSPGQRSSDHQREGPLTTSRRLVRYPTRLISRGIRPRPDGARAVIESARLPILFREADYMQEVSDAGRPHVAARRRPNQNDNNTRLVCWRPNRSPCRSAGGGEKEGERSPATGGRISKPSRRAVCCSRWAAAAGEGIHLGGAHFRALPPPGVEPATAMKILNPLCF